MGEIKDYIELYIQNSDILKDAADVIAMDLQTNMRSNLWKGHGYDQGELYKNITTRTSVSKKFALIIGFYTVEHGQYVISGVRGKGKAKSGPIDILNKGLEKTLEAYS